MSGCVNDGMDKGSMMDSEHRTEKIVDIYISAEAVRDMKYKKNTDDQTPDTKTSQHTGNASARFRSSRAAPVCLVLLYFLLLTAVIVLSVFIYTNNTNYTHDSNQLLTNITDLTEEKNQLLTNITDLTEEKNQLLTRITNITKERDHLLTWNTNITEERDTLTKKNINLTNVINQLNNTLQIVDGWIYYQFNFYYVYNETGKNWNESRRYCTERGADLVTINNKQEQDFVMNISRGIECWIGLTDAEVEGRWKWVDGTSMNSSFWGSNAQFKEPNGGNKENCVVTYLKKVPDILGWLDEPCNVLHQWICEKSISPLIQP